MKIFGKHAIPELSELDQFLTEFNEARQEASPAREQEQKRHEALAQKRDSRLEPQNTDIWEGF